MTGNAVGTPDNTAVRTALWRALHTQVDEPPHVLEDVLGARLAQDDDGWRERGDMVPGDSRGKRATIVGRARLTEDLVAQAASRGVDQYVILGAGLDTYAQRHPEAGSTMTVFEILGFVGAHAPFSGRLASDCGESSRATR